MTEETKQPKRRRRWLRFGLRTFLIVLTILCVWIGWFVYRVEQQREVVKWVKENGGTVSYEHHFDSDDQFVRDGQPPGPIWLHNILGVDYFSSVALVDLYGKQITDATPLAGLTRLQWLDLSHNEVCNLTPLAGLTNLELLGLDNTQVTNLTPLASLRNLKVLSLLHTQISDLTPLAGLTKLEVLLLENTNVSDEEIEKLQQALPNCKIEH